MITTTLCSRVTFEFGRIYCEAIRGSKLLPTSQGREQFAALYKTLSVFFFKRKTF